MYYKIFIRPFPLSERDLSASLIVLNTFQVFFEKIVAGFIFQERISRRGGPNYYRITQMAVFQL